VTLKVYTSAFRKVKMVEYPAQASGRIVVLDPKDDRGGDLSSGLYYLVLEDKFSHRVTGKLIIRK